VKISVLSLWRDSMKHIHRTFSQLESLEARHPDIDFSYFFYENDSVDGTKKTLLEWLENRDGKLLSQKLNVRKWGSINSPKRMAQMAVYRNNLLHFSRPLESDYTLVFDSDIIFESDLIENFLANAKSCNNWALLSANTRQNIACLLDKKIEDSYYDVACLLDSRKIPVACWWDCPFFASGDREKWYSGEPIKVTSAFGSCSLIKTDALNNLKVKWSSVNGMVEHVGLCFSIKEHHGGDIYVCPNTKARVWHKFGLGGDGSQIPWDKELEEASHEHSKTILEMSDWEQIQKYQSLQSKNGLVSSLCEEPLIENISLHKKVAEAKGIEKDPRNESIFSFSEIEEKESEDCK